MQPQKEYLKNFLKKSYTHYRLFVGIIFLIEVLFMIRFILFRGFKAYNIIYFCAYVFLAVVSLITFILLSVDKGQFCLHGTRLNKIAAVYSSSILIWSCVISSTDIYRGNFPIVYITVLYAISALNLIEPVYFLAETVIQTGIIMAMYFYVNDFDDGFFINFIIMFAAAQMISFRSFSVGNENYRKSEKLKKLSCIDSMTQAQNRYALDKKTERLINQNIPFTIIVGDIDSFKDVNDNYGHLLGDECLCFVTDRLCKAFPEHVFRYGGDEFVAISYDDYDEISKLLEPFTTGIHYGDICLHMSFGVMRYIPGMSIIDFLRAADELLYQSKKSGKATVSYNL